MSSIPSMSAGKRPAALWIVPAILAFLSAAAAFGFYTVFTRSLSQDEGYLMITLRGFFAGNPLYDSVYTQYGPFYYAYEWLVRTIAQIPLTHDATRLLCVFHWIAAAAVLGLAGWRLTRTAIGGFFVFAQAIVHLRFLADEPGHPQEIVAVLVGLSVLAAFRTDKAKAGACEFIALIVAALALTKINVGVFLGFSLVLALRCQSDDQFARASRWLLGALCAAVPFLLMHRHVSVPWGRNYAVLSACTLVATFFVATVFSGRASLPMRRYFSIAAWFFVPSILILAVAVFTGSSAAGLLDGLLTAPLNMSAAAEMPIHTRSYVPMNAVAALFVALVVLLNRTSRQMPLFVNVLKIAYGIAGALWFVGEPRYQFAYLLPWLWIVLVRVPAENMESSTRTFPRVFLCLAAAAQALQAYPVAGTQVVVGTMLLVVIYTVCLADGLAGLGVLDKVRASMEKTSLRTVPLVAALAALGLLYLFANVWCDLPRLRKTYAELSALNLPGSELVRMKPGAPEVYRELSAWLAAESDTFISYPCMNSLYFWAGKAPPTLRNGTVWTQFSHEQQREILAALKRSARPRLVLMPEFTHNLQQYGQRRELLTPLFEFTAECEPVKQIGPFVILAPKQMAALDPAR